MTRYQSKDHSGAFAQAFFIANLLFVGVFYLALWALYLLRYRHATPVNRQHLRQSLVAASLSTALFALINLIIVVTGGYHSVTGLFLLELYFMLIVPLFLVAGILGFTKAIRGDDFTYPLVGALVK